MKELLEAVSSLWWVPSLLPVVLQGLSFVFDNFLYKNTDFANELDLLENTNKVGKAKALKEFVESRFQDLSFESGQDDSLQDRCLALIKDITRLSKLDATIMIYRTTYSRLANVFFTTFICSCALLLLSLIVGLVYAPSRVWLFVVGIGAFVFSIGLIVRMHTYTEKLNKLKENEDLR